MMFKNKKIGCFSDIHLGIGQNNQIWHDISLNFAKWASEKFLEAGIDQIFIPGDVFHDRSEISVETLSVAKKFFDYFKDFEIIISSGNHDCYLKNNSEINSISIFDGWNNITIVDKKPLILETSYKKKICFVPWGYDINLLPKVDTIFGHFEIISFYMNNYKQCEHGLSYTNLFDKCNYVISGHFHKKDHKQYEKGEIVYLGSPYQQNFGDILEQRGIYIFDLEKNKFDFFENNVSPKFYKFSFKKLKENSYSEEELKQNIFKNFITLNVDEEVEPEDLLKYNEIILKYDPLDFKTDHVYDDKKNDTDLSIENYKGKDLMTDIEEYVLSLDIEHKKEVVEYLKQVYNSLV